MAAFKAAVVYFLVVFAAGFVLGPIRVLWAVPRFGTMAAELMEAPIMFAVVVLAARWVLRRFSLVPICWLGAGFLALAMMLAMEVTVVLSLRGLTLREYAQTREPVSGAVYLLLLAFFAVAPFLWARSAGRDG